MKNSTLFKHMLLGCLLTCAVVASAQQTTYEPDARYICPPNGVMTKLADSDYYHENLRFFIYEVDGKVGVVDERKLVVIPIEYDEIKRLYSNYYLIRKGDKVGVITQYGEFVFPPVLASISYGPQGFTLIDEEGTSVTVEDNLGSFDSDLRKAASMLALYYHWGNAFCLRGDSTTKAISLDEYWTSNEFNDGMMPVWDKNRKKLGFLNTRGEWAIPLSISIEKAYMEDFAFSGGYLILEQDKTYKVYNKKGQVLWSQPYEAGNYKYTLSDYVEGGYALLAAKAGNMIQWKYVSPTGKQLFPEAFGTKSYPVFYGYGSIENFVRPMCDDMVAFPDFNKSEPRWGFMDKNGKVIARGKYAAVHDFQDGLAAVQMPEGDENPNKWGFIDKTGKMVIPAIYSIEPGDFSEGLAVVQKTNGLKVYINKNGEPVSVDFSNAMPFINGTAFVEVYDGYSSKYFALDHSFNVVNFLLPSQIFLQEVRAEIEKTAKHPDRVAGDVFHYPYYNISQMINSRGELYFIWSDDIMTINSIRDGVVHVSYGEYGRNMQDLFCDTTGKVLFFLTRNEF